MKISKCHQEDIEPLREKIRAISVIALFLASCSPLVSSTQSHVSTPSPSTQPSPASTITQTPVLTSSPQPTPIGGAFIRIAGYEESRNSFQCMVRELSEDAFAQIAPGEDSTETLNLCPNYFRARSGPIWSPDGEKYVVCAGFSGCNLYYGDIYSEKVNFVIDLTKYSSSQNAIGIPLAPKILWLSDSEHIIFLEEDSGSLYKFSVITADLNRLGQFPSGIEAFYTHELEPSPKGDWILIQSGKSGSPQFWGIKADGTGEINFSEDTGAQYVYQAEWSPDGRHFAFYADMGDNISTIIMDVGGTVVSVIPDSELPSWSVDGKSLLFHCNRASGKYDLCAADQNGEILHTYSNNEFGRRADSFFYLSPDGKYISFRTCFLSSQDNKEHCSLYVIEVDTGETRELVNYIAKRPSYESSMWSPDGNWIIVYDAESVSEHLGADYAQYLTYYDSMLVCNVEGSCMNLNSNSFTAFWAEWWMAPPDWRP